MLNYKQLMKINIKLKRAYKSIRNKRNAKYNISICASVAARERGRGKTGNQTPNQKRSWPFIRYVATYRLIYEKGEERSTAGNKERRNQSQ